MHVLVCVCVHVCVAQCVEHVFVDICTLKSKEGIVGGIRDHCESSNTLALKEQQTFEVTKLHFQPQAEFLKQKNWLMGISWK